MHAVFFEWRVCGRVTVVEVGALRVRVDPVGLAVRRPARVRDAAVCAELDVILHFCLRCNKNTLTLQLCWSQEDSQHIQDQDWFVCVLGRVNIGDWGSVRTSLCWSECVPFSISSSSAFTFPWRLMSAMLCTLLSELCGFPPSMATPEIQSQRS